MSRTGIITGPSLQYYGDHVYGYNKQAATNSVMNDTAPIMYDCHTGDKPVLINVTYTDTEQGGYDRYVRFSIDEEQVIDYRHDGSPVFSDQWRWKLFIPANCRLQIRANINGVVDEMSIFITGKVLGL